jgi:hypothetical protein
LADISAVMFGIQMSIESFRGVGVAPNGGMNSQLNFQTMVLTSWS